MSKNKPAQNLPARKSLLEPVEAEKFKTFSARVPQDLSDEFDKLVERAKKFNFVITPSKIITAAVRDAVNFENLELDKFERFAAEKAEAEKTELERIATEKAEAEKTVSVSSTSSEELV